MTTKKRRKPLENLATQSKNKDKKELSPIEKDLLECCEKDQPVFLYGDNSIDIEGLIKRVYFAHEPDLEELYTSKYIDCGDMNGKEVYEKLASRDSVFLLEKGLLFTELTDDVIIIDNLHCKPNNDEDDKYYRKLGKVIKDRGIGCTQTTFNWLVACAHDDPQNFPEYFRDQFEPILLDRKRRKALETGVINELRKLRDKKPKTGGRTHFPTPSGAKWSDVTMYLIDMEHIKIKIKDVQETVTYSQMGFKHKTATTKKTKPWFILLGFVGDEATPPKKCIMKKYYDKKPKVEKDIQRLNSILKSYFGISGNPIAYKRYRRRYEGEFYFFDKSHIGEYVDGITDKPIKEPRFAFPRGYDGKVDPIEKPRSIVGKWKRGFEEGEYEE